MAIYNRITSEQVEFVGRVPPRRYFRQIGWRPSAADGALIEMVVVRVVKNPYGDPVANDRLRDWQLGDFVADGGVREIEAAFAAAPVMETV